MSRCILVGVDASLSLVTRYALEAVSQMLELSSSGLQVILLQVIPVAYNPSARWGRSPGSLSTFPPTHSQLGEAKSALRQARALLEHLGIPDDSIEVLVRAGNPADELVQVARQRNVDLLVLGKRPHTRLEFVRRVLFGSTTRRTLRLAPCRVLLAHPPHSPSSGLGDLAAWYEQATLRCLHQQIETLVVLTPADVARRFTPSPETVGHREVAAAACALERLAERGLLLCRVVQGEIHCWND